MAKSFDLWNKLFQDEPGRTFFPRECGNFPEMSLRNTECGKFPGNVCLKDNSRKLTGKMFPSIYSTGTLFPHRRMYKNCVSGGINVPVSTWEFPLF
jgi:hypothetical protein